jgi:exodeoxyribonuclease VII large subunit
LAKRGLWPKRQSYLLPKTIKQIGLITSENSKALEDFDTNYKRNGGKAIIHALFAHVKGKQAASEIARAINRFNQDKNVDVIVVTRGGGDEAELAEVFDSAVISEAICHSSIPVITAIGHTSDHSFTDEIADMAYSTPTEAAIRLAEIPIKRGLFS